MGFSSRSGGAGGWRNARENFVPVFVAAFVFVAVAAQPPDLHCQTALEGAADRCFTREKEPAARVTVEADVDNSGTIDCDEFIAATLHLNKLEKEDYLYAAFNYFDKDGSGYITADEIQQACEEFGIGDVRLEEMIAEVDQDNDGRIDYNEFAAMMQGNTGLGKKGLQSSFSVGFREALKLG